MSDQNTVTDWAAYFASLVAATGPGSPMSDEAIEAMKATHLRVNGPTKTMLIINDPANFVGGAHGCGGLLETVEVEAGISIEDARSYWDALGRPERRPEMWLQREWPWGPTVYIAPAPIVKKGKRQ